MILYGDSLMDRVSLKSTREKNGVERRFVDMAPLVRGIGDFVDERSGRASVMEACIDTDTLEENFGYSPPGGRGADIVLAEDTAVELGHPSTRSLAVLLLTAESVLVRDRRVTLVGEDIGQLESGVKRPFAQVVMLHVDENALPDPFILDNAQFLMNRLPGYMARSVPGKLWVRISRRAHAAGLGFREIASALHDVFAGRTQGVSAAEFLFVTSSAADVDALLPLKTEADVLAGKHKKLVLGAGGEIECTELNCETCDEKPVCDNLRDIVIRRRKAGR